MALADWFRDNTIGNAFPSSTVRGVVMLAAFPVTLPIS